MLHRRRSRALHVAPARKRVGEEQVRPQQTNPISLQTSGNRQATVFPFDERGLGTEDWVMVSETVSFGAEDFVMASETPSSGVEDWAGALEPSDAVGTGTLPAPAR